MGRVRGGVFSGAMVLAGISATLLSALLAIGIRQVTALQETRPVQVTMVPSSGQVAVPDATATPGSPIATAGSEAPAYAPPVPHRYVPARTSSQTSTGSTTGSRSSGGTVAPVVAPAVAPKSASSAASGSPTPTPTPTPTKPGHGHGHGTANGVAHGTSNGAGKGASPTPSSNGTGNGNGHHH